MNVGIIGYGKMGKLRHKILEEIGGHRVAHVCDTAPVPGEFRTTTDPDDLIGDPEIGAVFICTPNNLISDLTIRALDAGKHVFAEKPPGVSSREVLDMIAAEKRNPGKKLMFGFNHRYHESVREAKRRLDTGDYGKILWMRGRYGKSVDESFYNEWRAKRGQSGGGILMDQGIHMLDLLMYFAGGFDEVKSYCSNLYWNLDVEDNVFALLRNSENHVVASLHSTMTQWRHLFALEIFMERGYIVINGLVTSSMSYTINSGEEVLTIAANRTPPPQARHSSEERFVYKKDYSWNHEMSAFFTAIEEDGPIVFGNTGDSLELMQMIERIYKDGDCPGVRS